MADFGNLLDKDMTREARILFAVLDANAETLLEHLTLEQWFRLGCRSGELFASQEALYTSLHRDKTLEPRRW
jgi:hypothetical protein